MITTERMITYDSREVGSFLKFFLREEMSQYHFNNGEFKKTQLEMEK